MLQWFSIAALAKQLQQCDQHSTSSGYSRPDGTDDHCAQRLAELQDKFSHRDTPLADIQDKYLTLLDSLRDKDRRILKLEEDAAHNHGSSERIVRELQKAQEENQKVISERDNARVQLSEKDVLLEGCSSAKRLLQAQVQDLEEQKQAWKDITKEGCHCPGHRRPHHGQYLEWHPPPHRGRGHRRP